MFSGVTSIVLCILVAVTGCAFSQPVTPAVPDNLPPGMQLVIRDFDRAATEAAKSPNDIGYTLGVVTRDGLAWTKSYGYADSATTGAREFGHRLRRWLRRLYRNHAAAVDASGTVHFSDPVAKYLPEIKVVHNPYPDAAPVTLLQLAVHTSGLALDPKDAATYTKGSAADWEKTLIAALPHTSYEFEPGTHGALSNIDDSILALALSRAVHQPYSRVSEAANPVAFGDDSHRFFDG